MKTWSSIRIMAALLVLIASCSPCPCEEARVIGADKDLDGLVPFAARPLSHWRWTDEQKQQAALKSRVELVQSPEGTMTCSLRIDPGMPFTTPYLSFLSLGIAYLPPEADAIRMKVRPISGSMILGFGGPTAYYGNSDAFLRPVFIDRAKDGPDWRTVEYSLHHGLFRNFRRASFSQDAPWIYYARWAQEPTSLFVYKGSAGAVEIKDLEIVTQGIAKPFYSPQPGDIAAETVLMDTKASHTSQVFTALIGDSSKEFDLSWKPGAKLVHAPPELQIVTDPTEGATLQSKGLYLEEMSAVGFKLTSTNDGHALRFRIKVETQASNMMIPHQPCQPVDILLYQVDDPSRFDWEPFTASASEQGNAAGRKGYTVNLSYEKLRSMPSASLAIYHARRFVTKGQWSDVILPFNDFLCFYGNGSMTNNFQRQLRPEPMKMVAAAVLTPWPRKGRHETTMTFQKISLVRFVKGREPAPSYYQIPDVSDLKTVRSRNGKYAFQLLPGETELPPALKTLMETLD